MDLSFGLDELFNPSSDESALNENTPLSDNYVLGDLTITETGLPNIPGPETPELKNLSWLAKILEELENTIGPFTIISAYRSKIVQDAVTGQNPNVSRPKSFHEAGMAVDLYPLTMPPEEFFGRLVASNWVQNLGEIALKPSQNTLHLSLPGKFVGRVMIMDTEKNYIVQSPEQVAQIASPYVNESVEYAIESPNLSEISFGEGELGVGESGEGDIVEYNTGQIESLKTLKYILIGALTLVSIGLVVYFKKKK